MSYDKTFLEFNNGKRMPIIGLGTWNSQPNEVKNAVLTALEVGYRHIDTAFLYFNEKEIGEALKETFAKGKIKREDLFIVTKLPPNGMRPGDVKRFLTKSLAALQLDYVDLYLIHKPFGTQNTGDDKDVFPTGPDGTVLLDPTTDIVKVWKAMEDMVDAGLAKSIGVTTFSREQLGRILKACRIKPANNQVECHAYFQKQKLLDFCNENAITLCAYGPLGSPGYGAVHEQRTGTKVDIPTLTEDPTVKSLAEKHKKAPSHVLLRYLIQRGIAVIPKSVNPQRIKDNFNVFDFKLSPEDMKALRDVDKKSSCYEVETLLKGIDKHPEYHSEAD